MNELTLEELKQLVVFYKQKTSDLEYEILKGQLIMNRVPVSQDQPVVKNKKSE
jgi:hypothetical protein